MPPISPRYADNLLERYRAELEEINRRIRILEWLSEGDRRLRSAPQSRVRKQAGR